MKTPESSPTTSALTRRSFVFGITAGGIGLAFSLRNKSLLALPSPEITGSFEPSAWVRIDPDGTTTITVAKSEMGQGVRTSLAMIVAEEMDADWTKVKIRQSRPDIAGIGAQFTGGSGSVTGSYATLRQAGATVRAMLISAAAKQWGIPAANCTAAKGVMSEKNGSRKLTYGELTDIAATIPVPGNVTLKNVADFTLIGTRQPHIDNRDIVTGKAMYGMDVRVPGMKYAVMVRPVALGAAIRSFDAAETLKIPGVLKVENVQGVGLVVLAENTYAAITGRDALKINWNMGANTALNSAAISAAMKNGIGTVADVPANSAIAIQAEYELPYLAHATMEPMNCVADVRASGAEIWCPSQGGDQVRSSVANAVGLPASSVIVNTTLLGGGFGRRLSVEYAPIAARISKAFNVPVLFMFTRQDDMRGDYYRPASYHVLKGGLDSGGKITGWVHRTVNGGADSPSYFTTPQNVTSANVGFPVPTGAWRSVGHTSSVFVNECFIDELAVAAGKDPFLFRRDMLQAGSRLRIALEKAAELAEWTKPLPKGWGRGIACTGAYSYVAHVVEVSVLGGILKVERVVAAVDCGIAVNPMGVEAQMQGACVDALATALKAAITIENGAVKQSTFTDYEWLRMDEMPKIEVYIFPNTRTPQGMGEAGFPSVTPALCNAIFNATGKRIRTLPIAKSFFTGIEEPSAAQQNNGAISASPNPFSSEFNVQGSFSTHARGEAVITARNLLGRIIAETVAPLNPDGSFSAHVEFPPAADAMYLLTATNGERSLTTTVVKM